MKIPELVSTVGEVECKSNIVFAEMYQAQKADAFQENKVVNILAPHQLLYPVSFAVRKEEHILKNYINIKLSNLDRSDMINIIINELVTNGDPKDDPVVKRLQELDKGINKLEMVELKINEIINNKNTLRDIAASKSERLVKETQLKKDTAEELEKELPEIEREIEDTIKSNHTEDIQAAINLEKLNKEIEETKRDIDKINNNSNIEDGQIQAASLKEIARKRKRQVKLVEKYFLPPKSLTS